MQGQWMTKIGHREVHCTFPLSGIQGDKFKIEEIYEV
jgi:hypothetical protein